MAGSDRGILRRDMPLPYPSQRRGHPIRRYLHHVGREELHQLDWIETAAVEVLLRLYCNLGLRMLCHFFYFVETKGPTLEEIALLFDGPGANVGSAEDGTDLQKTATSRVEHAEKRDN